MDDSSIPTVLLLDPLAFFTEDSLLKTLRLNYTQLIRFQFGRFYAQTKVAPELYASRAGIR